LLTGTTAFIRDNLERDRDNFLAHRRGTEDLSRHRLNIELIDQNGSSMFPDLQEP
jgi:hypothetical protein